MLLPTQLVLEARAYLAPAALSLSLVMHCGMSPCTVYTLSPLHILYSRLCVSLKACVTQGQRVARLCSVPCDPVCSRVRLKKGGERAVSWVMSRAQLLSTSATLPDGLVFHLDSGTLYLRDFSRTWLLRECHMRGGLVVAHYWSISCTHSGTGRGAGGRAPRGRDVKVRCLAS